MRITSVRSTYCFVNVDDKLAQVLRVAIAEAPEDAEVTVNAAGRHLQVPLPWRGRLAAGQAGQEGGPAWAPSADPGLCAPSRFSPSPEMLDGVVVEVPVLVDEDQAPGSALPVRVTAERNGESVSAEGEFVVRAPGWHMVMVQHFHYDPVWWNTQAGYTSGWDELVWAIERRDTFQQTGLALVEAHLQRARTDPRYKFVLAEVDYLKPFWDLYPDRRDEMKALMAAGRLEIVGGTYNEPNTNLTGAETGIRAAVYGIGFQRDVLGGDPQSAWQLDVFGHDPQFPGIMAECGLTSSSWARGPFHQWGPRRETGSNTWMQFPSEFEWVAPNGKGLLTSYMPNHYSAGWEVERATTLPGAMWRAYELFCDLAEVAATKWALLPVGTDYTPPSRFITDIASAWEKRYVWPRFEVGLVKEFFDGVRAELAQQGRAASPQSRDMNPVYTGKDVSFTDTKQAQRMAETALADAEAMASFAALLGAPVPQRAMDKAWRQLVFGAHHDGITGSESDQVYLDLLAGWREAYELATGAEEFCRARVVDKVDTTGEGQGLVVFNNLGHDRSELVTTRAAAPAAGEHLEVVDDKGQPLPTMLEPYGTGGEVKVRFPASAVPGVGYRTYRLRRATGGSDGAPPWRADGQTEISNEHLQVRSAPEMGGGLTSIVERATGRELVPAGEVANELVVYPEYPNHPRFGEGPWHLLPSGPPERSRRGRAEVHRETSVFGEQLVVEGFLSPGPEADGLGAGFRYRQTATLWKGSRRLELATEVHEWAARDRLLRLRFPTTLAGNTPVSAVGDAVVARGFGLIDVDVAEAPWTLDNPACEWFGLSTTLLVEGTNGGRAHHQRAVAVAELVTPPGQGAAGWARQLIVALVQKGVTATCSEAHGNRYGGLLGDSNIPDFRVAVGAPSDNPFVADLLQQAGEAYQKAFEDQMARQSWARLLVPPERPLTEVWQPNADVRGARDLPVLVVAGRDAAATAEAVGRLVSEVSTGRVPVEQATELLAASPPVPDWTAAVLNRGTPSFAVDASGAMNVSAMRSCTGWPSGIWIDPPRRTAPDGSAFELEHWSHLFENALVFAPGDWRRAGIVDEALSYNRPMRASTADAHGGVLPPTARLLTVSPAGGNDGGHVVLAALKPAGNPLAAGDPPTPAPAGAVEVSLRCYEAYGQPAEVEVTSFFELLEAQRTNLVEEPSGALALESGSGGAKRARLALAPGEISTVRFAMAPASGAPSTGRGAAAGAGTTGGAGSAGSAGSAVNGAGPEAEPAALALEAAQPVFTRYWLHNKGAAPLGNHTLVVHMLPTSVVTRAGATVTVTAQVASSSAHATQAGRLELVAPEGWQCTPDQKLFSLAPNAFVRASVEVKVPGDLRPGRRFVAARLVDDYGQAQEDVLTVDVLPQLPEAETVDGDPGAMALPAPFLHPSSQWPSELEAVLLSEHVEVGPGGSGRVRLRLRNRTSSELRAEVQLISPWETWAWVRPWVQGTHLPPGEERVVEVEVGAPAEGWLSTWALFKVTYFGRLWYSPAVALKLGHQGARSQADVRAAVQHA